MVKRYRYGWLLFMLRGNKIVQRYEFSVMRLGLNISYYHNSYCLALLV